MRAEPDPKLKEAAAEIAAVLKKHDIAAIITLQSEDGIEFLREISPTWSCAFFERRDDGALLLRIRAKAEEYPSKEAQKKCVEETVGMIFGFHHQAMQDEEAIMQVLAMLARHFPDMFNRIDL
jgi:hypothetical protein